MSKVYKVNDHSQTFEKTTTNKNNACFTCFTTKEPDFYCFYCICFLEFIYATFFFFLPMFLFLFVLKGVSYCHKVFCLRCCKGLISSSVCTNMNCMSKQSYSITWQKIKTGHCEFNIWPLYFIFKRFNINQQRCDSSVKLYKLTTKKWLSSVKKWDICWKVVHFISNAFKATLIVSFLVV